MGMKSSFNSLSTSLVFGKSIVEVLNSLLGGIDESFE
jgi:hypothetical protein